MTFSSGIFLVYFLPLILLIYFCSPTILRNGLLLAGSIFLYWWGAPDFIWILLLVSGINFYVVHRIHNSERPKFYLVLYVTINLALLCYYKYFNFFIDNFNLLLEQTGLQQIQWAAIALPIGISFHTFHSITYGVDVYRKEAKPQKSMFNYWLFILFFPQLVAGPIVKYKKIAPQLSHRKDRLENVINGFYRFSIGLAKKVLIANVLSEYGDLLHNWDTTVLQTSSTSIAWMTALCYTFEIYFDFSGYSDMAVGLGTMFGFRLPENFNRPYLSKSITEFWRRWHISLGDFMRNYLYIPLGGNRVGTNRMYLNLFIVFTLSGLWHGASWNFILWGVFHGCWLIIERLFRLQKSTSFLRMLITFIIVLHGWVLFDADSFSEAWNHLTAMYRFESVEFMDSADLFYFNSHVFIATMIVLLGMTKLSRLYYLKLTQIRNIKTSLIYLFIAGILFFISLSHVVTGSFNPFIYFKF
ncbi:MBOAT family protein [Crocinitomicaceae bacterium CZZ-1]|uniref:MBOAT family protein n=1 Tax=Taishania pollutisoli TaxID=2766479 RepID=A0A8J6TZ75_9FLAO|nr:MBOAT family O-acyltransferase [Taishania pollutisoli]MBC9811783.1 MBOAT family protein [Taishania pollutisoli]